MARFVRPPRRRSLDMIAVAGAYVTAALWLGWQGASLGQRWFGTVPTRMSSSSVIALLSATASGMIAFTGIVFSLGLVGLQFGATAYGPRIVAELGRGRILAHGVGLFTGTFLYALSAIRTVDLEGGSLNLPVAVVAVVWLLASIVVAILMLPRIARMSIGEVLTVVGERGRQAAARVFAPVRAGAAAQRDEHGPVVQVVVHRGAPAHVVGFDVRRLVAAARAAGASIEIPHTIGGLVQSGQPLVRVRGGLARVPESRLRRAVWLAVERATDNDPAYALRLLADAAIRGLSPAINDPTTAVDVLDRIQPILEEVGRAPLEPGRIADDTGAMRLSYEVPTWEDLVGLAIAEIAQYGCDSVPVQRRLRALVDALVQSLPPHRHAALLRVIAPRRSGARRSP